MMENLDTLKNRLNACMTVELLAADIYRTLAKVFPKEAKFFRVLSREEENHAAILATCMGFLKVGKLPKHIVPDSISAINKTMDLAREIQSKITSAGLSLDVALQLTLELENSIAENHLQAVLNEASDIKIIKRLRTLQLDSEHHANRIRDFIGSKYLG